MPRARKQQTATRKEQSAASDNSSASELTCPECGRTFARPAALGAHRSRAHGVAGTSAGARRQRGRRAGAAGAGRRRRGAAAATARTASGTRVNRDALLRAVFPNGMPANAEALRNVTAWLEEADRLAKLA